MKNYFRIFSVVLLFALFCSQTLVGQNRKLEESVVNVGLNCGGVIIDFDKVLTTSLCARNNNWVEDHLSIRKTVSKKHYMGGFSIKNNLPISGGDLAILELQSSYGRSQISQVHLEPSENLLGKIDAGSGISSPLLETIYHIGRNLEGDRYSRYVNFRYPLDPNNKESIYGSKTIQFCERDRGSPIFVSDKLAGLASRPTLIDTHCGNHISWIFVNTFSADARDFIRHHIRSWPQEIRWDTAQSINISKSCFYCKRHMKLPGLNSKHDFSLEFSVTQGHGYFEFKNHGIKFNLGVGKRNIFYSNEYSGVQDWNFSIFFKSEDSSGLRVEEIIYRPDSYYK